jgi:hydroxypyruvate isomerase
MNRRQFSFKTAAALVASTFSRGRATARPAESQHLGQAADKDLKFKLSVMLWTVFRDLPFEQRLEKVAQAGYRYVELVSEYAQWSEDDFARANKRCKELEIRFDATAGLKHGLANPADRDAMLHELGEALVAMEKLDCPSIILLTGNVTPGLTREAQHQSCIDGLKAAAKLVEGKKIAGEPVRLLLESIDLVENPKYFLPSAAEGFDIVKAVDHRQVRFLFDLFHEQMGGGNLIDKLRKNVEYVGLIHVADVPGRHEPGTGEINYENIFRALAELKYDRVVAMEFLATSDPVAKLAQAREMAWRFGRQR